MKLFVQDHNFVCSRVAKRFEQTDNLLQADVVLLWSDIPQTEKNIVSHAKELNKPIVMVQHGRRAVVDYLSDYKDINSPLKLQKIQADKVCVWGKRDYEDLIKEGYPASQIILSGCPLIPPIPEDKAPALITFLSHHDLRLDAEKFNQEIHEVILERYGKEMADFKGRKIPAYCLVTSPQYEHEKLTEAVKNHSFGKCKINGNDQFAWVTMASVFRRTKVCVSLMPSSFEGLACYMDIPTVRVKCDLGVRDKQGNVDYELSDAVDAVELKDLIGAIEQIVPNKRKEARKELAEKEMLIKGQGPLSIIEGAIRSCVK